MGNLKCGISQKRLIIERKGWKFGTQGNTVHIGRALLMPDSLSLVWGHSIFAAGIFNFGVHPNFVTTLATMVNLNACLLEYCNDKLAFSIWGNIIILFKTFQDITLYWVFSSSRASRPPGLLLLFLMWYDRFPSPRYCACKHLLHIDLIMWSFHLVIVKSLAW